MIERPDYLSDDEEKRKTYLFFKSRLTDDEEKELIALLDRPHAPVEKGQT